MQGSQSDSSDLFVEAMQEMFSAGSYDEIIDLIPNIKAHQSCAVITPLVIKAALNLNTVFAIERAMELVITYASTPKERAAHAMVFAKADRMTEAFLVLFGDPRISWIPQHMNLLGPVLRTIKRSLNKELPATIAATQFLRFIGEQVTVNVPLKAAKRAARTKSNFGFSERISHLAPKLCGPETRIMVSDQSCGFQKEMFSRGLQQAARAILSYKVPNVFELHDVFVNRFGDVWKEDGSMLKQVGPSNISREVDRNKIPTFDRLINACAVESSKNPYLWCARFLPSLAWRWDMSGEDLPIGISDTAKSWVCESMCLASLEKPTIVEVGEAVFVRRLLLIDPHMYFLGRQEAYKESFARLIDRASEVSSLRNKEPFYISRRDAARRAMLNEAEFEDALRARGIKPVILSGLSFAEKVNLFREAPFMIGAHGAGFANLVFSKVGRQVLEILPTHTHVTLNMAGLSRILGHSHTQYIALPKRAYEDKNWEFDMRKVPDMLSSFMKG